MASQSAAVHKSATVEIRVQPINGFIGAEIEGIDLRQPLSPAQFKVVHDALVQYEVIVLRDQDITIDQQMAFGALFGELSIHPFSPNLTDKPEVIILDYSKDNPPALTDIWHVDETFRETPPLGTILRGKSRPAPERDSIQTLVAVRDAGGWSFVSFHNTRIRPIAAGGMSALLWLLPDKLWRLLFRATRTVPRATAQLDGP